MEDIEEIKRRKLLELQKRLEEERAKEQERIQQEIQKKAILRQILTSEARTRLNTIRMAKPELAEQVENLLIQLALAGKIGRIDDAQLKKILAKIAENRREIRIRRI